MNTTRQETERRSPPGLLFVWTDVDEAFEDDFNRWYDQEHIEERVRIPGVLSGTRYQNRGPGRRYLGLYRTEVLDVFDSAAYRQAFSSQSPWSVTNLSRMRDPMRRVCAIENETGFGTGAWLAVLLLDSMSTAERLEASKAFGKRVQDVDGVISTRLLMPDTAKSTPLPNETSEGRKMDPILLIDATNESSARDAAKAAGNLVPANATTAILAMMWQLRKSDLGRSTPAGGRRE
ncbi:MAG: hypothetical protein QOF41_1420 [Methylobacteriaceae bacterium]|nr:hypothetical protein [Methylobacteriaceae bacterium]